MKRILPLVDNSYHSKMPNLSTASKNVAVLFARSDSIYKSMPHCDVFDATRDALTWAGGSPIVAHPPCRAWGRLRTFANPREGEKALALWAVEKIRQWGGVLEHPAGSTLWKAASLPQPGRRDAFGGFTLPINQHWFGHKAEKATFLYIVGCNPADLPALPLDLAEPSHVVATRSGPRARPEISKADRERTPPALAAWLVAVAASCVP